MIFALGYFIGGLVMWRQPGPIARTLALVFLFCGTLAGLALAGAA